MPYSFEISIIIHHCKTTLAPRRFCYNFQFTIEKELIINALDTLTSLHKADVPIFVEKTLNNVCID